MKYYLKSKEIYVEDEILNDYYLLIKDGKIERVEKNKSEDLEIIELGDLNIIPGLVDLHIHGADGYDVMDGNYEALNNMSLYLSKNGVTSFLATTLTAPLDKVKKALVNVKESMEKGLEGAEVLGSYLEGPYLTEEYKGAHPVEFMRKVSLNEIKKLIDSSEDTIKVVTIAPEKENSLEIVEYLKNRGIKTSIGHTNATYDETMDAIEKGASIGVHTFNGMRGLHHREPGVVGAIMDSDKIYGELISDNIHVNPAVMRILYKLKGKDKLYLITDCMMAGGLDDGEYQLGELKVNVKDSIARTESGSLAGSTLKLKNGIKNIMNACDIDLFEGLKLATIIPAKALGIDRNIGSIREGKRANLTVIDDDLNIYMTIVNGKIVYRKNEGSNKK
ncbi:N-acetylglucosamine-6-phosphate deacetylase [Clostridium sp. D2Q-14]|uniref:N-acetylglucosamine-6-phosphate deacetylase n=1 Tax=Anaeromonas gelatinilytica TaxID=2683194 RepID=UPI00193BCE62|nr:N-acetylglucosamine-6-phosphate deacetylase [Anaeromonas gelatinilytica]MBS4535758.1 N-acetylglucosamine-6-phosphate deacetylase [Anaeromonas gelatinilytica]